MKTKQWRNVVAEEYNALLQKNTWELVPSQLGRNPVGCKWVFKLKYNSDGNLSRYKARLVAKGYHQQQGFDYNETFSLVAKSTTIRILFSFVVSFDWSITQLDVSNAFLHEEVYMIQPLGFTDPSKPHHLCKLQKLVYGLKQALRAWYEALQNFLISIGFHTSNVNHYLFVKKDQQFIIYLLIYVDEILLTGSSP